MFNINKPEIKKIVNDFAKAYNLLKNQITELLVKFIRFNFFLLKLNDCVFYNIIINFRFK